MYSSDEEMWESFKRPGFRNDSFKDLQEAVRSPIWKAVSIVYEKYKRKYKLSELLKRELINYLTIWSNIRESEGKKIHLEILIQECSAEIKRRNK
jgi:hypothetical protein